MMPTPDRATPLLAILLATLLPTPAMAGLPVHTLDNGTVRAGVTEAIGGRLLSFALAGQPNFLRVDDAAGDPDAAVDANSGNVAYYGHEVWAGPQQQWWAHQDVNPARKAAKAVWPPDPYLSLARYTLDAAGRDAVAVTSPASPVSGLQLVKRYALVPGKPNSLRLDAGAINRRGSEVAWDLWFNTRVPGDTQVYVPVGGAADVRTEAADGLAPPQPLVAAGVLALEIPAAGQTARRGKLFAQPAAGWMAAFRGGQAFIVQFALQPRAAIHPDQGQVELYQDVDPARPAAGLLEMEVHAPWRRLAPGQRMDAHETWTLLPYAGPATRAAHLAFLRAQARTLALHGL
jgi:hypothetical protein